MFEKAVIFGTGLIGGSLGLELKAKKLCRTVLGMSRSASSVSRALRCKAIDKVASGLSEISDADLIVLAAPVETIIEHASAICGVARPDALIFDVASTKRKVVSAFSGRHKGFVGTHPLAGSEKRGIGHACLGLFKGCRCIITADSRTDPRALRKVEALWRRLGAVCFRMSPQRHDELLASVSHFPHLLAFALMNAIPLNQARFGAGGLRDTTRIAASDPQLWAQILLSNKDNVRAVIRSFDLQIKKFESALRRGDIRSLTRLISQAHKKRISL